MNCAPTSNIIMQIHSGKKQVSEGVSLFGISETAEKIDFRTKGAQLSIQQSKKLYFPSIFIRKGIINHA